MRAKRQVISDAEADTASNGVKHFVNLTVGIWVWIVSLTRAYVLQERCVFRTLVLRRNVLVVVEVLNSTLWLQGVND